MKVLASLAIFTIFIWLAWKLQSPESYLKKKTQKVITMISNTKANSDMALISKVSKVARFIHFDVRLKAEYKGQIWIAKSLNEFRSLLFSYFRQEKTRKLDYKNLSVNMTESNRQALVKFDAFFGRQAGNIFCKVSLKWVKEKKWYIKSIEVLSCVPITS